MERKRHDKAGNKITKGAVYASVMKALAASRGTGAWLQRNVRFDQDRYLNEENKLLASKLLDSLNIEGGYKAEQKLRDTEILLANLFQQTRKPVSISLNQNDYKQSRYNKVSYFIVALIYYLKEAKYIKMKRGFNNVKENPRMTRIWATDKLLSEFPLYTTGVFWKPTELVVLRDSKGKLKEYTDTRETWRIRDILKRVNEVNSKADIRYKASKLSAFLVAIFVEKFTWYGRLHSKGFRHYQGIKGKDKERAKITINGDPIKEWDYSGLHPNLLYAAEGIQYKGDPYSVVDKRPEARPFLKAILLCMLNAKNEITAERAANYWLYEAEPTEQEELKKLGITRARPFIDKFMIEHEPIAHYFCKGKDTGMRVMNKDSKIALDIVNHFAKQDIPILSVHDSFIVQEKYREELLQVMKNEYKKHTGFRIKIK